MENKSLLVRITDKKSPHFGKEYPCQMVYYSTRSSPTMYYVTLPTQLGAAFKEKQIDLPYYRKQELAYEIKNLKANVGDIVKITRPSSGYQLADWDYHGEHTITGIDPSGHVKFDGGICVMFRPGVEVIVPAPQEAS